MQIFRAIALVLFVVLAAAMVSWQGLLIWDMAGLGQLPAEQGGLALLVGVLVLCGLELLAMRMAGEVIHKTLWVVTAPLRWVLAGFARLVMGRGVDVTGFWRTFQLLVALLVLNVALPLAVSSVVAPNLGLPAGIAAVLVQFFLFTDWHMGRALIHFFTSGASAFVSLRYLRKRPISLASVIGVAAGVGVLIVVNSIMNGFVKDYREQIRGSLSHVLMYLSPRSVVSRSAEVEAEAWRMSVERLKTNAKARAAWEHARALALEAWEQGNLAAYPDGLGDEYPVGRVLPEELSGRAKGFLADLESPTPARVSMLTESLPVHPELGPATPENIILQVMNPSLDRRGREEQRQRLRADVRGVMYVPRVMGYVDHLGKVAAQHPDFEAASPRIRNIALLKGGLIPSSPEDASMIVAVDPEQEPRISDLGKYAGAAEFQAFKEAHHLRPTADILDYLLVFEALDGGPVESDLRAVAVEGPDAMPMPETAPGDLAPFTVPSPDGPRRVVCNWSPEVSLLSARRYIDTAYNVLWGQVDGIRWRPGSPGAAMYPIVREGMKEMARADAPGPLKSALVRMNQRLTELCEQWLARPGVDSAALERSTAVRLGPQYGHYAGDDAAIMFFRDRFLDGVRPLKAEVARSLSDGLMAELRRVSTDPELVPSLPAGLPKALDALDAEVKAFVATVLPAQPSAGSVIGETRKLLSRLSEVMAREEYVATFQDAWDASPRLKRILANLGDPEAFLGRIRMNSSLVTPLSEMLAEWDGNWKTVEARRTAYATVLPLRTRLLEHEAVDEYLARARAILPAIPPNNRVWRDSDAVVSGARSAATSILTKAFAAHRLSDGPLLGTDATPVVFPGFATLKQSLREQVDSWVANTLPTLPTVKDIQGSLDSTLLPALEQSIEAALTGTSPVVADAVRRHFAPITDQSQRSVYFQVRAAKPGLLLGDTMSRRNVAAVGMDLRIMVVRQTEGSSLEQAASLTGDEDFVVGGVYRSGIFADNAQTMYTDFASYAALLGETNATTLVGVKLKDYGPWEGRPLELKEQFEQLVRDDRMAAMRMTRDNGANVPDAARMLHGSSLGRPVRIDIWELERAKLLKAVEREKTLLTLLLGLNMVLAGVVILIVVYLTVVEKVKDIGILKALGASPWGIRSIFMFNALFIGLFGTLIGGAAGVLISQNLNSIEDWIDATFGLKLFPPDIYYLTYVPSVKDWPLIELAISIGAPATLWAFFCGILPAMAASKKETVEALHYE